MSRWQPMASVVMMAPSITNMSRSAGMAMISLDLSATLTWPSTRRWRAAKADTMWIAAFAPFLLAEPRNVLPSMATTSADTPISLATQATKRRWNSALSSVAKMSPRWSCDGVPSRNGRNRRRNAIFFWPNRAISTKVSAPASTASKHKQQHLLERVDHLAALPRVRKIPKTPQKNNRFAVRRRPRNRLHRALRKSNQEDHDRFSTSAVCHALLHPIALGCGWSRLRGHRSVWYGLLYL